MKNFKALFALITLVLILDLDIAAVPGKTAPFFFYANYRAENQLISEYCYSGDEPQENLVNNTINRQTNPQPRTTNLNGNRVEPPRLFNIPTARVLGSKDINLTGGGAIGVGTKQSLLGTIGVGLGNIAEVEFSTMGLVNNIANGYPVVTTSAFKLKIIPDNFLGLRFFPTLAVAIRSSSDWKQVRSDEKVIRANDVWYESCISNINYATRFTILYGVSSLSLGPVNLHGGVSLTDIRIKDTIVEYWNDYLYQYDPAEIQKNLIGGFAGIEIANNPQTKIMCEIETVSNWEYNSEIEAVEVRQSYLFIGGVRFFFTNWLSVDTGIWYQDNFRGIADSQIKLGLNIFIPGWAIDSIPGRIFRFRKTTE